MPSLVRTAIILSSLLGRLVDGAPGTTPSSAPALFTDPLTGITFLNTFIADADSKSSFAFGLALPTTPGTDFIGRLETTVPTLGWTSIDLAEEMKKKLMIAAYPDKSALGGINLSGRYSLSYKSSPVYTGNKITITPILKGMVVNESHITATFVCGNCINADSFAATADSATFAYGYSSRAVKAGGADLNDHTSLPYGSLAAFTLKSAQSPNFAQWVTMAGASGGGAAAAAPAAAAPAAAAPAAAAPAAAVPAAAAPAAAIPAAAAPAAAAPASTVPAAAAPAPAVPAIPASSVPASSVPASSVPASSVPASSVPASSVPAASVPVAAAPVAAAPVAAVPVAAVPASTVPASAGTASTSMTGATPAMGGGAMAGMGATGTMGTGTTTNTGTTGTGTMAGSTGAGTTVSGTTTGTGTGAAVLTGSAGTVAGTTGSTTGTTATASGAVPAAAGATSPSPDTTTTTPDDPPPYNPVTLLGPAGVTSLILTVMVYVTQAIM